MALDSRFGFTAANGDAVPTWTDLTRNGNNATQGTAGNRPLYNTNAINGQPAVSFDGTNDTLTGSAASSTSAYAVTMALKRLGSATSTKVAFSYGTGNGTNSWAGSRGTTPELMISGDTATTDFFSGYTSSAAALVGYVIDTAATPKMIAYLNGLSFGSTSTGVNTRAGNSFIIGNHPAVNVFGNFQIGQLCIFNAANYSGSVMKRVNHAAARAFRLPCN